MTLRQERPSGLGRGLASLIPQRHPTTTPVEIPTDRIRPNPLQPRRRFDDEALATLTASITEHGVLQPVLVTETIDGYQLVAGERRWRAAVAGGLDRIPAVVRRLEDRERLELALVENLQREDLDPLEAAAAYRQLVDEFGFSIEQLGERIGRARSTVANTLRLLELAQGVQDAVSDGRISEGHARAIGGIAVGYQERVLTTVIEQALSVRQTEELVRRVREPRAARAPQAPGSLDPDVERLEQDLRQALGTKVRVARSRRGGRIVIEYYSDEELGRLFDRLTGGQS